MARPPAKSLRASSKASAAKPLGAGKLAAAIKAYFKHPRGTPLPSLRALAQQHGVSRATLTRALFSSVKASHGKLVAGAAVLAGVAGFNPRLPQRISMVDSALHLSVGHSHEPLKRAFDKTGLFPPDKKQMLAAAAASIKSGKQKVAHAAWKRLAVTPDMVQAAVQRSAEEQPALYDRAVDRFYNRQELSGLVAARAAKKGKGACK
ncbi:hypothetical protein V8C86DRAFT_3209815 [Haematococcus lacustris]